MKKINNNIINDDYTAKDIVVLEKLDAVRQRPGMYIGTTGSKGMHHLLWEIVDNSLDEISNGYGDRIDIEIFSDNSVCVRDNARGIPIDIHPDKHVSAIELVFTELHAGGKFDSGDKYQYSGGLHGVGASVVNALSKWLIANVYRNGLQHTIEFHSPTIDGKTQSGIIKTPLSSKPCDKSLRGTKVHFLPDDAIFKGEKFSFDSINKHIREMAFLNAGLTVALTDHRDIDADGLPNRIVHHYEGGIKDFTKFLNENKEALYDNPLYIESDAPGFNLKLAIQHTCEYNESIFSYVNNIPTAEGGTHETGFKTGLTKVLNDYARASGILKDKQSAFLGEDLREGMTCVLAIKMKEVQFEGQTKTKLGTPSARGLVENAVSEKFKELLLRLDKGTIDKIFNKAHLAMKIREEQAKSKDLARKRNNIANNSLIGKLAQCNGRKYKDNELFIVEGDSAGGSAKSGRDKAFQAILPIRGKTLNSEKTNISKILENEEIGTIINALGAGFHNDFNTENLKYGKVIILADADQDGGHIRAILLTFFFRYMKQLIMDGHVYIGMPPLYKVTVKDNIEYAYDDDELKSILDRVSGKYKLQRYKGLGEMNPDQLWETTMNPAKRLLTRVTIDDAADAEYMITTLMGNNIEARKKYINQHACFNKQDLFDKLGV